MNKRIERRGNIHLTIMIPVLVIALAILAACSISSTDSIIFRDDFEGELNEDWFWVNEDPSRWSISDEKGWLSITADNSSMLHKSEIIGQTNVLVRPAPEGDFTLTVKMDTQPAEDFQQAGIYIIEDGFDYVAILVSFCMDCSPASGGEQIEMKAVRDNQPLLANTYIPKPPGVGSEVSLRLAYSSKVNSITGFYSFDGVDWEEAFQVRDAPPFDKVGLSATNSPGPGGVQRDLIARFDFFELIKPATNSQ
jgi:beta-xylosidase